MKKIPLETGRVARSVAGRDEGRQYVVIAEIDEDFVLVADGGLRTMSRPKKKRRRHLEGTQEVLEGIKTRIADGGVVLDHELRKALKHEEG